LSLPGPDMLNADVRFAEATPVYQHHDY